MKNIEVLESIDSLIKEYAYDLLNTPFKEQRDINKFIELLKERNSFADSTGIVVFTDKIDIKNRVIKE